MIRIRSVTIIMRDVELLWLDKPVLSDGGGDSATYNMMTTAAEVCTPWCFMIFSC